MTALFFTLLVLVLIALLVRTLLSAPLLRTLSIAVDNWADSVHGQEAGETH